MWAGLQRSEILFSGRLLILNRIPAGTGKQFLQFILFCMELITGQPVPALPGPVVIKINKLKIISLNYASLSNYKCRGRTTFQGNQGSEDS
jgi:hypothetical protein